MSQQEQQQQQQPAGAASLPLELLEDVLARLDLPSRLAAACVCRKWRAASAHARVWEDDFRWQEQSFGHVAPSSQVAPSASVLAPSQPPESALPHAESVWTGVVRDLRRDVAAGLARLDREQQHNAPASPSLSPLSLVDTAATAPEFFDEQFSCGDVCNPRKRVRMAPANQGDAAIHAVVPLGVEVEAEGHAVTVVVHEEGKPVFGFVSQVQRAEGKAFACAPSSPPSSPPCCPGSPSSLSSSLSSCSSPLSTPLPPPRVRAASWARMGDGSMLGSRGGSRSRSRSRSPSRGPSMFVRVPPALVHCGLLDIDNFDDPNVDVLVDHDHHHHHDGDHERVTNVDGNTAGGAGAGAGADRPTYSFQLLPSGRVVDGAGQDQDQACAVRVGDLVQVGDDPSMVGRVTKLYSMDGDQSARVHLNNVRERPFRCFGLALLQRVPCDPERLTVSVGSHVPVLPFEAAGSGAGSAVVQAFVQTVHDRRAGSL